MANHQENAIKAVKEYLIFLLEQNDFCNARRIGEALEILVSPRIEIEEVCERPTGRALGELGSAASG